MLNKWGNHDVKKLTSLRLILSDENVFCFLNLFIILSSTSIAQLVRDRPCDAHK